MREPLLRVALGRSQGQDGARDCSQAQSPSNASHYIANFPEPAFEMLYGEKTYGNDRRTQNPSNHKDFFNEISPQRTNAAICTNVSYLGQ